MHLCVSFLLLRAPVYIILAAVFRLGSEREACIQLLQKCYNLAERGTPLAIKSAVCLDHLKGFFYVEAFRDSHVSDAMVIKLARDVLFRTGHRLSSLQCAWTT
jgi:hypothetical protein